MLKKDISYEGFDGQKYQESFYFHLSKPELIELQVSEKQGFEGYIREIIAADDHKALLATMKQIIKLSIGERSPDGKRFMKSEKFTEEFLYSRAYEELFMELTQDEGKMTAFIKGVLPSDLPDKPNVLPPTSQ